MQVPVDNDVFQFAKLIAAEAANLTLDWFQSHDLKIDIKADNTEVTDADKAVEEYLRTAISKEFPNDTIIGEESENFLERRHGSGSLILLMGPLHLLEVFLSLVHS